MNRIIATIALTLAISLTVSSAFARPWRWEANQKNTVVDGQVKFSGKVVSVAEIKGVLS